MEANIKRVIPGFNIQLKYNKIQECARNEIRTRTSLRMPPPQDGASTNFATRAFNMKYKVFSLEFNYELSY